MSRDYPVNKPAHYLLIDPVGNVIHRDNSCAHRGQSLLSPYVFHTPSTSLRTVNAGI